LKKNGCDCEERIARRSNLVRRSRCRPGNAAAEAILVEAGLELAAVFCR